MKKFKLTALALGIAIATGAAADPFYIQAGTYGTTVAPGDADTRTNDLESLGFTDSLATSIYFGLTPGSTVIDTNDAATLSSLGIAPVLNPDERLIETMNPTQGNPLGDPENFFGTNFFWGSSILGGTGWGMTYTYVLNGEINGAGTGVDFNSGYFDLFFEDGTTSTQLIRLELGNFQLVGETDGALYTVLTTGNVTFDWAGDADPDASVFAQNFFVDAASGKTFYELWTDGEEINPLAVSWRLDNNIDCPPGTSDCAGVPLLDQLTLIYDDGEPIGGYRRTTVDGTLRFAVPEPGSLALLGLGLFGLGMSLRRRKSA